jgi:hypothetical protein
MDALLCGGLRTEPGVQERLGFLRPEAGFHCLQRPPAANLSGLQAPFAFVFNAGRP